MKDLPFKAVAIDVDGTFVNDEKKYDHEMFGEILYRLHKHGAHFIIASGRPAGRLEADFGDFIDSVDFVADNGAVLVRDGKIIHTTTFSKKCILNLVDYLQPRYPGAVQSTLISGVKHSYFLKSTPAQFKRSHHYFYPNSIEVDNFDQIPEDDQYTKVTVDYPSKVRRELEYGFNSRSVEKIHVTTSGWNYMDIIPQNVNKANGLKEFLAYLDVPRTQLIAFGDGKNDIEMLKLAGLSYAMENGQDSVKKIAKFIAPSNNDNGVFKVLNKYLNETRK
ncbi:Cof-type HAD-IIB family hydrolase [Lactobacillus helveticus]|uniref:Cof-type HAD-IIB family hydrolase n=1 Tax=Lactobacillus helveticus TaxID=1587 RepID=UPI0007744659|nr:Cof-type HAD-IIB family hydrolase [Lactobacillus helveticus]KXN78047.1 sugar-phosphatase [Lactobacillus helveticus]